jgi:CubicO group peptidase (beta-lactamase class C family)
MERFSAERLADWAAEARERWNVPGIAMGLLRDGEIVSAADGLCELGRPETVSPETVFRIASITKPFTATLAMTLVQDGLLSLDEPPPASKLDATVRQLLSHQGGLACEWPEPLNGVGDGDDALLRLTEGEPELLPVAPGELFSYSNTGFWFVAAAIARALGTSFEEAMRTRVLEPLGLQSTGFEQERPARGHDQVEPSAAEHAPTEKTYPRVRRPSGGLWSSVADLLRFAAHNLGGPGPLTPPSIAEMQRPQVPLAGGSYGLGWLLAETRGLPTVEHAGSVVGFQSLVLLAPNDHLAVAALTNSSRGSAAIRDVLEHLGLGPARAPERGHSAAELAALNGRYHGQYFELEIASENGGLSVATTEVDPFTHEEQVFPTVHGRPVAEREFEIVDGESRGERFDFPRQGFVRFLGRLAARTE